MESNHEVYLLEVSDRAMCSPTTIRGVKNGTIQFLSAKKALEISHRLNGPKDFDGVVSLANDQTEVLEAKEFQNRFSHLFSYDMQPGSFNPFLSNKDYARIIWDAFGATNITRSEIEYR
jgi:hypothetical protein